MARPSNPSTLRVVVAEDDDDMRTLVADALRRDGHHVTELQHGGQVLALLALDGKGARGQVADLLVTDVNMPCVDGVKLVRALRAAGWTRPAVMITAFGDAAAHASAAEVGALILDKPFRLHDLRQLVITAGSIAAAAGRFDRRLP